MLFWIKIVISLLMLKLSTNNQYLHGYEVQVGRYGSAENTQNLIYVFIDIGNPRRKKAIAMLHKKHQSSGKPCPELVIIDARKKSAASTFEIDYDLDEIDLDADSLKDIDLEAL